jgi:hypothetical protein
MYVCMYVCMYVYSTGASEAAVLMIRRWGLASQLQTTNYVCTERAKQPF